MDDSCIFRDFLLLLFAWSVFAVALGNSCSVKELDDRVGVLEAQGLP